MGDGLAIVAALRADPQFSQTPIILMSAATHVLTSHKQAIEALHCRVLTKPLDLDAFDLLIDATLATLPLVSTEERSIQSLP